jgi:hypothetical protein
MASTRHRVAAAALCALAVLVAHDIAYRLVITDTHERNHLLHESGHGWWVLAPFIAGAALAVAAFATASVEHVHRLRWALGPAAACLYVTIEVSERVVSGGHHGVVHLPTLLAGAVIAAVFGLLAAVLLAATERVVVDWKACRRRQVYPPMRVRWSVHVLVFVAVIRTTAASGRGPPVFLPAV